MNRTITVRQLGSMVLCTALIAAPAFAQQPAGFSPELLDQIGIDQRIGEHVPLDLELVDEQGNTVQLSQYFGRRPVLLSLVYLRCPMLCNMTADGLVKSLKVLKFDVGREFEVLTVSFDPREGPELAAAAKETALERYNRQGAAEGWHFLTGRQEEIERLAKAVGFRYVWDEARGQYAHAAGIMVITPEGKISHYLHGVEFPPRDVRLAVVEASQGKVGSITDQVMLLCYQYDPTTGKYGLLIYRTMRAAGLTTVVALAALIGILLRRERRGAHAAPAQPPATSS